MNRLKHCHHVHAFWCQQGRVREEFFRQWRFEIPSETRAEDERGNRCFQRPGLWGVHMMPFLVAACQGCSLRIWLSCVFVVVQPRNSIGRRRETQRIHTFTQLLMNAKVALILGQG